MIHAPECQSNCPCCGGDWDCDCGAITFTRVPVAHDRLCPQQPRSDGATLTMLDGTPIYCACDLIAKARAESVDRAIIHLVLHGFHPDRLEWAQRFRESVVR